jgi:hypothetical protein
MRKTQMRAVSMLPEPHGTDVLYRRKGARVSGGYDGEGRRQRMEVIMQSRLEAAELLEVTYADVC